MLSRGDAGTGIQRVVRALLLQLAQAPPGGFDVLPVEAGRWHRYRHAPAVFRARFGLAERAAAHRELDVGRGDLYLGLDYAPYDVVRHARQFDRWRRAGAKFVFVVHDLLPLGHPEWFGKPAVRAFQGWLQCLATYADGALCTSRAGRDELAAWLAPRRGGRVASIALDWFHLGGDIEASAPSRGTTAGFDAQLARLSASPSILLAGTLEPRKGHALALSAFERIWAAGRVVNLVFAGRAGWGVDALLRRIRAHPESGRRLVWLEDASDEMLCAAYRACAGLLMASEAEGFGLPIVEAARFGKPVLARDLPVFREIAGEHAAYFRGGTPEAVALEIEAWLDLVRRGRAPRSEAISGATWEEGARRLRRSLESIARAG